MPAVLAGCSWKDPNPPVRRREKALFFLNFSYVCPEPVLVKPSFLYQDDAKKGRFCHLPHFLIFFRNDRLPRQARDEHRESCQQINKACFCRVRRPILEQSPVRTWVWSTTESSRCRQSGPTGMT
eukprot:COSAG06_NODE_772_length_12432_cov_119.880159_5_plen_125_part_00